MGDTLTLDDYSDNELISFALAFLKRMREVRHNEPTTTTGACMSPYVSFTKRDLLRGKVVEPAWYLILINNVGEGPSKDGGSTNYPVEGTIVKNAETDGEEFKDVAIDWNLNSKAMGAIRGFLECLGVNVVEDTRYELSNAAGKYLEVFVENDTWQGRMVNRVNHKYRTPRQ